MKSFVIGLDLSLTSTGVALIAPDWKGTPETVKTWRIAPEIAEASSLRDQAERIKTIREEVIGIYEWVLDNKRRAQEIEVFIENHAFSKNTNNGSKIVELTGTVKDHLFDDFGVLVRPITAASARKLFLGAGHVKKGSKLLAQQAAKLVGFTCGEDEIDAFVVANFGFSELGGAAIAGVVDAHKSFITGDRSPAKAARRRKL